MRIMYLHGATILTLTIHNESENIIMHSIFILIYLAEGNTETLSCVLLSKISGRFFQLTWNIDFVLMILLKYVTYSASAT